MESFKRKYYHMIKEDRPTKLWKHFDKMVAIMKYQEELKETERPEESSDGTFSSVYVDEVTPLLFNDEESSQNEDDDVKTISSSTMSVETTLPKKAKRRCRTADNANVSDSSISNVNLEKPKQRRRFWILQEEQIFLDVWEKYVRDLRGDRKKTLVYRDMELEFQNQGINIKYSDVKAKIESLTRKFRKERDSVGTDSEWVHYAKVAELLGALEATKLNQYSDTSASSYCADDSCLWFNDDLPLYPQTCLKYDSTSAESVDSEQPCKRTKINPSESNADNAQDGCNQIEQSAFQLEVLNDEDQENNSYEKTCRPQLTEQFGKFVTKELNMLSDELLNEAKTKIYNILCLMQMKQIQLNNTSN